jgi:hypothetical protein
MAPPRKKSKQWQKKSTPEPQAVEEKNPSKSESSEKVTDSHTNREFADTIEGDATPSLFFGEQYFGGDSLASALADTRLPAPAIQQEAERKLTVCNVANKSFLDISKPEEPRDSYVPTDRESKVDWL